MMNVEFMFEHATLTANETGRDFVVGDIHGEYTLLMQALTCAGFNFDKDRLIAVGDVIDRGAESFRCLQLFKERWFYSVLGNHELMLLKVLNGEETMQQWYSWGGYWHSHLNAAKRMEVEEITDEYLINLPKAVTIMGDGPSIGLVHADPPQDWSTVNKPLKDWDYRLWGRERITREHKEDVSGVDVVFVGHTPLERVRHLGNVIYLDTGSGHPGGNLTVLDMQEYAADFLETRNLQNMWEAGHE